MNSWTCGRIISFEGEIGMEKKVREKSRECHNHKPQPFPDTKKRETDKTKQAQVEQKALRLALSSPSEVIAMPKGLKTQEQNNTRQDLKQIAS